MNFKNVDITDMEIVFKYFERQNSRMSDFTLGSFFEWAQYLSTQYAIKDDRLYIRFFDRSVGHYIYASAENCTDTQEIEEIVDNVVSSVGNEHEVVLAAFPMEKLDLLKERYEIRYDFERMWSDYLYDAESFRTFAGKKYHSKRNHISRFLRDYGEFSFEEITSENIDGAIEFLNAYSKENSLEEELYEYELEKSKEVIRNLNKLKMNGRLLCLNGKIIGLTAGSVYGDTLFVHIEKALREYNGAYTVLANQFAKQFPSVNYINREDDAGDEGLRKSKLSYYPIRLIDKYVVHIDAKK